MLVFVSSKERSGEIEDLLLDLGFPKVRCYVDGLRKWKLNKYMVEYPRFINFRVSGRRETISLMF